MVFDHLIIPLRPVRCLSLFPLLAASLWSLGDLVPHNIMMKKVTAMNEFEITQGATVDLESPDLKKEAISYLATPTLMTSSTSSSTFVAFFALSRFVAVAVPSFFSARFSAHVCATPCGRPRQSSE